MASCVWTVLVKQEVELAEEVGSKTGRKQEVNRQEVGSKTGRKQEVKLAGSKQTGSRESSRVEN